MTCLNRAKGAVDVQLSVPDRLQRHHGQPDVLQVLDRSCHLRQHLLHVRVNLRQDGLVADVHVTTDEVAPRFHFNAQALLQRNCVTTDKYVGWKQQLHCKCHPQQHEIYILRDERNVHGCSIKTVHFHYAMQPFV